MGAAERRLNVVVNEMTEKCVWSDMNVLSEE